MRYKVILLLLIYSILSCNGKPIIRSMNQAERPIMEIKQDVFKGDVEAYQELKTVYLDYSRENLLFWSLIMANKHQHPKAYIDVFYCIVDSYINGDLKKFNQIDITTRELALSYLNKASKLDMKEAKEILVEIKK